MNVSIDDLLDEIDDEIDKAWSLPLTGGKRAISADWLREKIDDVRANMPSEVRQAKNIVADRAEIISTARREAEAIIRKAEERARRMMSEEEVYKQAEAAAAELLAQSQQKAREMRKGATDFAEDILRRTEEVLAGRIGDVRQARQMLRSPNRFEERPDAEFSKK